MKAPFDLERDIINSIANKNEEALAKVFTKKAIVVLEGKRLSGDRIIDQLLSLDIKSFTVDNFEVVLAEDIIDMEKYEEEGTIDTERSVHQAYFNTRLAMKAGTDQATNGEYSIATTWKRTPKSDELVFAMISKN